MPSIVPGFEYDIFISYRQNDNLDGWVTDFVQSLEKELKATVKEPVSVYFDSNPHSGLLETHSVDKSLEGKLTCVVFIPILSQTYCDPKSFAWQHEFCAFNKLAKEDRFGRDVKLRSGNVASRILPVQIHELDQDDQSTLEKELGNVLRSIEFIYQTTGVARPLLPDEIEPKANLKHIYYRDQINKVVRGVKEILMAMHAPAIESPKKTTRPTVSSKRISKKLSWAAIVLLMIAVAGFSLYNYGGIKNQFRIVTDKSIAVIPFANMNNDPDQDYLSDGMSEDILNHLVKIEDLKVKSRTSTIQYKNSSKTIKEIGDELGVGAILVGSVRKLEDKIRIVVNLVDVKTDTQIWSESYDREIKDVFSAQSEIALEIANVLKAKLSDQEKLNITSRAKVNSDGYEHFLRARQWTYSTNTSKSNYLSALLMVNKAIRLDPKLAQAYALKGQLWYILGGFGIPVNQWRDSALYNANKAIELDNNQPDGYVVRGNLFHVLSKLEAAKADFMHAYEIAPNNSDVLNAVGLQFLEAKNKKGADMVLQSIEQNNSHQDPNYFLHWYNIFTAVGDQKISKMFLEKLRAVDPGSGNLYWNSAWLNRMAGNYELAVQEAETGYRVNPDSYRMIDNLGWAYYDAGKYEQAENVLSTGWKFEKNLEDTSQRVPFRIRLAMVKLKLGKNKEAEQLFKEQRKVSEEQINGKRGFGIWGGKATAFYDLGAACAMLGQKDYAIQCLDSAYTYGMGWYEGYSIDPMLAPLQSIPTYQKLVARVKADQKFMQDAFREAINKAEASRSIKSVLEK